MTNREKRYRKNKPLVSARKGHFKIDLTKKNKELLNIAKYQIQDSAKELKQIMNETGESDVGKAYAILEERRADREAQERRNRAQRSERRMKDSSNDNNNNNNNNKDNNNNTSQNSEKRRRDGKKINKNSINIDANNSNSNSNNNNIVNNNYDYYNYVNKSNKSKIKGKKLKSGKEISNKTIGLILGVTIAAFVGIIFANNYTEKNLTDYSKNFDQVFLTITSKSDQNDELIDDTSNENKTISTNYIFKYDSDKLQLLDNNGNDTISTLYNAENNAINLPQDFKIKEKETGYIYNINVGYLNHISDYITNSKNGISFYNYRHNKPSKTYFENNIENAITTFANINGEELDTNNFYYVHDYDNIDGINNSYINLSYIKFVKKPIILNDSITLTFDNVDKGLYFNIKNETVPNKNVELKDFATLLNNIDFENYIVNEKDGTTTN